MQCLLLWLVTLRPAVTYAVPAPVVGYVAPAPAVTYAAPAPVIDYVAPAPSVTFAAPAPVFEYVAPAPVLEYFALAAAVSFVAPSQQLRPAYTAATVPTGVNLDAAVVGSASQIVGSLPHGEVFAAPVFSQVHQEQLAGGVSRVAHTLPPAEEFTEPVYSPVHLEQFSAGDTTENIANFPVVPEQVVPLRVVHSLLPAARRPFPGMRPGVLVDPGPALALVRHSGNQLIDDLPSVQILDAPMPQMAGTVLDFCRTLDLPVDEQVITVPKFSPERVPQRLVERCFPQLAEQLVEVPTLLSYSLLQQRTPAQQKEEEELKAARRQLLSLLAVAPPLRTAEQLSRIQDCNGV